MTNKTDKKTIARNKKAKHNYFIEETIECGIELKGTEVKSLRQGKASIKEAYADIKDGELFIFQMNIPSYEFGNINNVDPLRTRKLLAHKREIKHLAQKKQKQGYTIVPLHLYFTNGLAKIEIGLARGKKLYDKRESLKQKDISRRLQRYVR